MTSEAACLPPGVLLVLKLWYALSDNARVFDGTQPPVITVL
jgi:hypothetical protein